jgi:hypothetical protein
LIEKSDGNENGVKMIAGVHIDTLTASATILAPSAPSLFDARFRLVIAPISRLALAMAIMPRVETNQVLLRKERK